MGFVVDGRYVLAPVEVGDANKYVDLQLRCLAETYPQLLHPDFAERQEAQRDSWLKEFATNIADPAARAFFAYETPGWTPSGGLSCVIGAQIDWGAPVGFALSGVGAHAWEEHTGVTPVSPDARQLTHLYTLARTHGTGLGAALFNAVIYPEDSDVYLWVIANNERAKGFYTARGFISDGEVIATSGAWEGGQIHRMFRGA
ncbi:GNAT family N-acetyltransferase [Rothia sp. ZJ932]|uniref:GNAT family N-acetyltransferase n=1 Tax=Rothia sp. ZJ932 TaxID=2810516 RepID=UPI00196778A6|nr:GNAT family N-acetyltransferase [Rothia sp. ZJ932]QRZ61670.1 GNAT family N-acetyltransferase [Rothia sp. ZJ932]